MPCFLVPVVVDRVEDEVAIVEIAGSLVDVVGLAGAFEGQRLRLCAEGGDPPAPKHASDRVQPSRAAGVADGPPPPERSYQQEN